MSMYYSRRHCPTYEIQFTIKRLSFLVTLVYIYIYFHLQRINEINYVFKSNIVCFMFVIIYN